MAKNITLMGADYPGVPAVQLPQTGGGTATFYTSETKTITGATDANGFLDTDLKTAEYIILSIDSLKKEGSNFVPYFAEILYNGGNPGIYYALRFKTWNDIVLTGNLSAVVRYMKI